MALAQAQLLSILPGRVAPSDPSCIGWRAQSYWVGQLVVLGTDVYEFRTFDTGVIVNSSTGDAQTLAVELPATTESHRLVETSMGAGLVWQVMIIQFESLSKQSLPRLGAAEDDDRLTYNGGSLSDEQQFQIVSRFYGEVVDASSDGVTLSLQLGPSLSPTGSQVPPRKFLSSIVGAPLRL
jgi:hypothetical protein